jgi:hypothetical protein
VDEGYRLPPDDFLTKIAAIRLALESRRSIPRSESGKNGHYFLAYVESLDRHENEEYTPPP